MEAVPRMPMISFELKHSPEYVEFGPTLKKYIRDHYGEDPAHYNKSCNELEQLRQSAVHVSHDFMGCSTLKKYYSQLQFLQGRFPMLEGGEASIAFTWEEVYTGREMTLSDIKFEQACILYNIGALHSVLGALDTRQSADGMKVSCTHFQCAAWAFEYLRDHFGSAGMSLDMTHELLTFQAQLMLAQAQECILEKSMTDSRKNTITAKVAAQIVEFYNTSLKHLDSCNSQELISSKRYKDWKKKIDIKVLFYTCITHFYMGRQSEDQQKHGQCLTYFTLALDKLLECEKLAKNEGVDVQDTLRFAHDVVGGKHQAAKKDNDFVYHEKVPAADTLPEVKGASLVKGIPFNPDDPEISGPDIFNKLVPMSAHEAASLYSEEKANLVRRVVSEIQEKNEELTQYLASLQLDQTVLNPEPERLPQQLLEKCAALSVRPTAIKDLVDAMTAVSNVSTEVELGIKEIQQVLQEESKAELEFQDVFGKRNPNAILSEIAQECARLEEGHKKGSQSNTDLHKAMNTHINNLKLLSSPLEDLQKLLPSLDKQRDAESSDVIKQLNTLLSKIEEMRTQRQTLEEQLRKEVLEDDITGALCKQENANREVLFSEQLKKHDKTVSFIRQNLAAQNNILKALTDANAKYASVRRATSDALARREQMIRDLVNSYDVYEDLKAKSQKGLDFYKKLETNVGRLLTRCRNVCKVQHEERQKMYNKYAPKAAAPAPGPARPSVTSSARPTQPALDPGEALGPVTSGGSQPTSHPSVSAVFDGPKLKDYLPFMKPKTFGKKGGSPPVTGSSISQGGSLPGSGTASPVHLPQMSGSVPASPDHFRQRFDGRLGPQDPSRIPSQQPGPDLTQGHLYHPGKGQLTARDQQGEDFPPDGDLSAYMSDLTPYQQLMGQGQMGYSQGQGQAGVQSQVSQSDYVPLDQRWKSEKSSAASSVTSQQGQRPVVSRALKPQTGQLAHPAASVTQNFPDPDQQQFYGKTAQQGFYGDQSFPHSSFQGPVPQGQYGTAAVSGYSMVQGSQSQVSSVSGAEMVPPVNTSIPQSLQGARQVTSTVSTVSASMSSHEQHSQGQGYDMYPQGQNINPQFQPSSVNQPYTQPAVSQGYARDTRPDQSLPHMGSQGQQYVGQGQMTSQYQGEAQRLRQSDQLGHLSGTSVGQYSQGYFQQGQASQGQGQPNVSIPSQQGQSQPGQNTLQVQGNLAIQFDPNQPPHSQLSSGMSQYPVSQAAGQWQPQISAGVTAPPTHPPYGGSQSSLVATSQQYVTSLPAPGHQGVQQPTLSQGQGMTPASSVGVGGHILPSLSSAAGYFPSQAQGMSPAASYGQQPASAQAAHPQQQQQQQFPGSNQQVSQPKQQQQFPGSHQQVSQPKQQQQQFPGSHQQVSQLQQQQQQQQFPSSHQQVSQLQQLQQQQFPGSNQQVSQPQQQPQTQQPQQQQRQSVTQPQASPAHMPYGQQYPSAQPPQPVSVPQGQFPHSQSVYGGPGMTTGVSATAIQQPGQSQQQVSQTWTPHSSPGLVVQNIRPGSQGLSVRQPVPSQTPAQLAFEGQFQTGPRFTGPAPTLPQQQMGHPQGIYQIPPGPQQQTMESHFSKQLPSSQQSQGQSLGQYNQDQNSGQYSQGQDSRLYSQGQSSGQFGQGQSLGQHVKGQSVGQYGQGQSTGQYQQNQVSAQFTQGQPALQHPSPAYSDTDINRKYSQDQMPQTQQQSASQSYGRSNQFPSDSSNISGTPASQGQGQMSQQIGGQPGSQRPGVPNQTAPQQMFTRYAQGQGQHGQTVQGQNQLGTSIYGQGQGQQNLQPTQVSGQYGPVSQQPSSDSKLLASQGQFNHPALQPQILTPTVPSNVVQGQTGQHTQLPPSQPVQPPVTRYQSTVPGSMGQQQPPGPVAKQLPQTAISAQEKRSSSPAEFRQPHHQGYSSLPVDSQKIPVNRQLSTASSLDEILSSSPEAKSEHSETVLAPKVLTAQEIQQQKEDQLKNSKMQFQPKDPYKDKSKLDKFVAEVEKLAKFVEGFEKPLCSGPTPLDVVWKELLEEQEKACRKHKLAIARCYPMKNRDQDVMPYDDSRVLLTTMNDDYINASWINDLSQSCPKFIATQAPLPVTLVDFWLMIYEQGVEVLVALSSETEIGKKFPSYLPKDKGETVDYGTVQLTLQSIKHKPLWTERILHLRHAETRAGRTLVHLHYNSWPVSGFPEKVSHILQFITEVHSFYRQQRSLMKPIVVHCSNGVGRTGMFQLIYVGMQEINHGHGIVNVQEVASNMLRQRRNLILKQDQLKFCYQAILYYAQDVLAKEGILVHKASFGDGLPKPGAKSVGWEPGQDILFGSMSFTNLQTSIARLGAKNDIADPSIDKKLEMLKKGDNLEHKGEDPVDSEKSNMQEGKVLSSVSGNSLPDVVQNPGLDLEMKKAESLIDTSMEQETPEFTGQAITEATLTDLNNLKLEPRGSVTSLKSLDSIDSKGSRTSSVHGSPAHQSREVSQSPKPGLGSRELSGSPKPGTSTSSSLAELQDPEKFTIGTNEGNKKKKITKADFTSEKKLVVEQDPADPLSSLDPFWTLK